MASIELKIIKNESASSSFFFTIKLTEKTAFLVQLMNAETCPGKLFISKLNTPFIGGKYFKDADHAVSSYKNKNMQKALAFMDEYIAQGMTGEVNI